MDEIQKKYNQYIEERKILIESHRMSSQSFDKAILTLSSGSFAFTIAFLKELVPSPIESTLWALHLSWILFAFSILIILVSFLTSQKACLLQIDNSYDVIVENKNNVKNFWSSLTTFLNYSSVCIIVSAYTFWGLFIYYNF